MESYADFYDIDDIFVRNVQPGRYFQAAYDGIKSAHPAFVVGGYPGTTTIESYIAGFKGATAADDGVVKFESNTGYGA